MKILVLGAGGTGGYFGGRLAAAGVNVSFLVRPPRAELLARQGLVIISPLGDLRIQVEALTETIQTFDAVLLACKAYDLNAAIEAIAPAVGASTVILPLLNGVRHLDVLDAHFGRERVMGGLCHIGVTMSPAGEIHHLNTLQRLVMGPRTPGQIETGKALHREIERGGFEPVFTELIMQEMWEKFTFLATYAGMTTLMRAPIGAILAAEEGEAITLEMLRECVATAAADACEPRSSAMQQMVSSLTERGSSGTASMFRDILRNSPTEHEHIIGDMLARARAAKVSSPLLRLSLAHLQAYDAKRSGLPLR